MKKNIRIDLIKPLLTLSLGLNLAFAAMWVFPLLSWHSPGPMPAAGSTGSPGPPALHKKIGVTDEQWGKLAPLVKDFRGKAVEQRKKNNLLRNEMMALLATPGAAIGSIRFLQEDILWNQHQMQNLVIEHLLREKKILSPEQMEKLVVTLCLQCSKGTRGSGGNGMGCTLGKKLGKALNPSRDTDRASDRGKEKK